MVLQNACWGETQKQPEPELNDWPEAESGGYYLMLPRKALWEMTMSSSTFSAMYVFLKNYFGESTQSFKNLPGNPRSAFFPVKQGNFAASAEKIKRFEQQGNRE